MDRLDTTTAANRGSRTTDIDFHYTHGETEYQFKIAIFEKLGNTPDYIIADGKIHRFGDKLQYWYVLYLDSRAAGSFGDWKTGEKYTWKLSGKFMPLSEFQRQAFKAQSQRDAEQRQRDEIAKHSEAASKAVFIWQHAKPAPANHPYLIKKHIKPHGARTGKNNTLIIPLYKANKEFVNLQFISENGTKRFLSGGKKKGCFWWLGDPTEKVLICEGFATGASLFEDSGYLTIVAFDPGNLKEVAKVIRSLYLDAEIIICGDNDESGVGQKAAIEAALSINGKYLLPPIVGRILMII